MLRILTWAGLLGAPLGCGSEPAPKPPVVAKKAPPPRAPTPAPAPKKAEEHEFFAGLGAHGREISTASPLAQRYFNQGLAFLYAFNHDEAIRSFEAAAKADPSSAMAYWGIAMANGPHINFPLVPTPRAKAAWEALGRAQGLLNYATDVERALVQALAERYTWPQPADRKPLDEAFAAAMRRVWDDFPRDADIGALYAEALMDLRPWDLWTQDGKPQPGTAEILRVLETVLYNAPAHPLANHLYIHAVEASPHPEKADAAAEALRNLQPGLGHMVHMPTHIDVRRGRWEQAEQSNANAIEADRRYRQRRPVVGFYNLYMAHNHHMLTFAAMMSGRSAVAISTIRSMIQAMPPEWIKESAAFADGFVGMPMEVLMRFGRWEAILREPEPPAYLPIARALRLYARGVARAAKGDLEGARVEQQAFLAAQRKLPATAAFGNNTGRDLLGVAEKVLEGELLVHEGKKTDGIKVLREAVAREDRLRYDEPPDWIQPVRHALGAALLRANRFREAEAVYREDLKKLPGNVWSLHGLASSLHSQKRKKEAEQADLELANATRRADMEIISSCLCLPGV